MLTYFIFHFIRVGRMLCGRDGIYNDDDDDDEATGFDADKRTRAMLDNFGEAEL